MWFSTPSMAWQVCFTHSLWTHTTLCTEPLTPGVHTHPCPAMFTYPTHSRSHRLTHPQHAHIHSLALCAQAHTYSHWHTFTHPNILKLTCVNMNTHIHPCCTHSHLLTQAATCSLTPHTNTHSLVVLGSHKLLFGAHTLIHSVHVYIHSCRLTHVHSPTLTHAWCAQCPHILSHDTFVHSCTHRILPPECPGQWICPSLWPF